MAAATELREGIGEALLAEREALAEEMVGADPRSARLRETLRAYLAAVQNASAAPAMLGVHEHTVDSTGER